MPNIHFLKILYIKKILKKFILINEFKEKEDKKGIERERRCLWMIYQIYSLSRMNY